MPFQQIPTSVTILNSCLIGYQGVSLTNFDASSASLIAAGSAVEVGGSFFLATENITPDSASWTAITTATTAYLSLVVSGTVGSQLIGAYWIQAAPVWSTSKQGWYASAASVDRVVASAYKTSPTVYSNKQILGNTQNILDTYRMFGKIERITSGSGNWIVPNGVYKIRVTCVGGGGGGGGGYYYGGGMVGGGGGGGTVISRVLGTDIVVSPGQSCAYSVGSGGSGGSGLNSADSVARCGSSGGNTTFSGAATGNGGGGAGVGVSGLASIAGLGPTGGAGDDGTAFFAYVANTAIVSGGKGGGAGGRGGYLNGYTLDQQDGRPGNYGGGGGGGLAHSSYVGAGGAGGSGIIIIEY